MRVPSLQYSQHTPSKQGCVQLTTALRTTANIVIYHLYHHDFIIIMVFFCSGIGA